MDLSLDKNLVAKLCSNLENSVLFVAIMDSLKTNTFSRLNYCLLSTNCEQCRDYIYGRKYLHFIFKKFTLFIEMRAVSLHIYIYIYIYIYITDTSIFLFLSLSLHIYIYIYYKNCSLSFSPFSLSLSLYIYIYIYIKKWYNHILSFAYRRCANSTISKHVW